MKPLRSLANQAAFVYECVELEENEVFTWRLLSQALYGGMGVVYCFQRNHHK